MSDKELQQAINSGRPLILATRPAGQLNLLDRKAASETARRSDPTRETLPWPLPSVEELRARSIRDTEPWPGI